MSQPDVEELLLNESFVRYCLGIATPQEHEYWTAFQRQHVSLQPVMAQARDMVLGMHLWGQQQEIATETQKLQQLIHTAPVKELPAKRRNIYRYMAAAAVVTGLLAGTWLWLRPEQMPVYVTLQTGIGQVKQVTLPDGSQVWLNANTTLQYADDFTRQRQLLLKAGEVFCRVQHSATSPFSVTTASGLQVQDIGTAFSVKSYPGLPVEQVGVTEGVVAVAHHAQQQQQLHKGDGLQVNRQSGHATAYTVQEEEIGWTTGHLVLNNADFKTFLLTLENQYGVNIQVKDAAVYNCSITASFTAGERVEAILDNLKLVYGISYRIHQNQIELHGKGCQ